MNRPLPANNIMLFDLEVLRARVEIRDFFLKNLYREVYENIGQVLGLARVLLAQRGDKVEEASELVGKSIRDLRALCRSFYPDEDLLKENGFSKEISGIIDIIFPGPGNFDKQFSAENDIDAGKKLIVFSMLLELLQRIKEINGKPGLVAIKFTKENIDCILHYRGDAISLEGGISLQQRAELINGKFDLQNADGITHLKLFCPLN